MKEVFFLDWDDTVMPSCLSTSSTFVTWRLEFEKDPKSYRRHHEKLESLLVWLFDTLLNRGEVVVITNAETAWIRYSVEVLAPKVLQYLSRIAIVSGKDRFSKDCPSDPVYWKQRAFEHGMKQWKNKTEIQLISFGDQWYDRTAFWSAVEDVSSTCHKFLLFPSVEEHPWLNLAHFFACWNLVLSQWNYFMNFPKKMDLKLQVTYNI